MLGRVGVVGEALREVSMADAWTIAYSQEQHLKETLAAYDEHEEYDVFQELEKP